MPNFPYMAMTAAYYDGTANPENVRVTPTTPMPVTDTAGGGVPSTSNASSTLITTGNNYTGTWEDVGAYGSLTVAVATDQNGYYEVQFSVDGTNVDSTLTRYYRTALINPPHRFTITRRYVRVVFYNNSGSNQTYFRLQVLLGNKEQLNVPLGGVVSLDYDAAVTRPSDYFHAVTRGLWQGRENWVKFGYNDDVDIGTEVVWANGATFGPATIKTSADTMSVVSSATTDNQAGTGARSLVFFYLDSNGLPAQAVHSLHATDGTIATTTSFSAYGVNRVAVYDSGGSYVNDGAITVTWTTGGAQAAILPAGGGVTQQSIFFTPHGYEGMINDIYMNVNKISGGVSPRVTLKAFAFNVLTTQTKYELFRTTIDTGVENTVTIQKVQPLKLSSSDVFWWEATTDTNNTVVNVRFALTINRINST